jgi:hypothetical protein
VGLFSVNYTAINDPARHVQFGFQVIGPNVWNASGLAANTIDITAVPEPTTMALAGIGAAMLMIRRRK